MKVRIKKLCDEAVIPKYSKFGDAGLDLVATSIAYDEFGNLSYGTGLAFEIPEGYVGLLFPRSSIFKYPLALTNSVGVVDSGYRGEVLFKFKPALVMRSAGSAVEGSRYEIGERIGQIVILPYPQIEFDEVTELVDSERGASGYGSTGN